MIKSTGAYKKHIKWFVLSLYLVTGSIWGQISGEIDVEQKKQWREQFWAYLESSEYPQFRTRAAIRLIRTGDSQAIRRGEQLIAEVLDAPIPDPASLWLLASGCQLNPSVNWCGSGRAYELLAQADPHNAAVILLRFDQTVFENDTFLDTEANRQLLFKAADADYFDIYWGRGADKLFEEALAFLEIKPMQVAPGSEELVQQFGITGHKYVYYVALTPILIVPLMSYGNIMDLCRLQARNQQTEGIKACVKLADMLRERSGAVLTRFIGYSLEEAMLKELDSSDIVMKPWKN